MPVSQSRLYSSGACHVFVDVPPGFVEIAVPELALGELPFPDPLNPTLPPGSLVPTGQPGYLGTGETAPEITLLTEYKPWKSDWGGAMLPRYRIAAGSEARVIVTLTRWDEQVLAMIERGPTMGAPRGTEAPGDAGCLIGAQVKPRLWLRFTKLLGICPGYRFPCAVLGGPRVLKPGTGKNWRMVVWDCQRVKENGNLVLYDHDMSAVVGAVIS